MYRYLLFQDAESAYSRSEAAWTPGPGDTITKYRWSVMQSYIDDRAAIQIPDEDIRFLNADEQNNLVEELPLGWESPDSHELAHDINLVEISKYSFNNKGYSLTLREKNLRLHRYSIVHVYASQNLENPILKYFPISNGISSPVEMRFNPGFYGEVPHIVREIVGSNGGSTYGLHLIISVSV